jgi:hypothetical protein
LGLRGFLPQEEGRRAQQIFRGILSGADLLRDRIVEPSIGVEEIGDHLLPASGPRVLQDIAHDIKDGDDHRIAMQETRTIPIVFALVADPIGSGFVAN